MTQNKERFSLRTKLAICIFILMFLSSTILIIAFHVSVTRSSFNSLIVTQIEEFKLKDVEIGNTIVDTIRNQVSEKFWQSIIPVLSITAIIDIIVAYLVSAWISIPIEKLRNSLKTAYQKEIPFASIGREEFVEVEEISSLVASMTTKYNHTLELQNQFIQEISHELKTPLAAIKSSADLIKINPNARTKDYKEFFEICSILNKKIINLVNQLTLSGKSQAELYDDKEIDLCELIRDILKTLKPLARQKGITFSKNITKNLKIKGDFRNLFTAFSNILENSIKYTEKKPSQIQIILKKERNKVEFIVKDQGIGIPSNDIKLLPNKFYRAKNTYNTEGSGLGLTIANNIILAHSGILSIKSTLGAGTEVKVVFIV